MDPANKVVIVVAGGLLLTVVGACAWLLIRQKKVARENAERAEFDKARMSPPTPPETPPRRSESTVDAGSSSSHSAASESSTSASRTASRTASEPAASTSASEPAASTSEPAANERPAVDEPEPEPKRVIVGNRRRCYSVPPGAVVELKTPISRGHGAFQASRSDVEVNVLDARPNMVRVQLSGPSGPVNLALLEPDDSKQGHRVVTSWKFELLAA